MHGQQNIKIKEIIIHLKYYVDKSDTSAFIIHGVSFTYTQNVLYFVMAADDSAAFQTSVLL